MRLISQPEYSLGRAWQWIRCSSLSARIARGAFWTLTGTAIARAAGLAGSVLVARCLGKKTFGEFGILQSTVGMFGTFAGLGLGVTATKYVAEWRQSQTKRCGLVITMTLALATAGGAVGSMLLAIGAPWLAQHALASVQLTGLLRSSALLVFLGTVQAASVGALTGFEAFRRAAWVNIVGGLAGAPLIVLGAVYFQLAGAVWGLVAQAAVSCIFSCWVLWRQARIFGIELVSPDIFVSLTSWRSELLILWRFSLPAFLSSLLVGPVNWFCNTFLVRQPDGYGQVAILGAANQWKNLVGFLPLMFSSVLVPMLAGLHAEGRQEEFGRVLKTQIMLNAGMCLLLSLPLAIFARSLMGCYGPGFIQGVPVLVLTLISTAVIAANNLLSRSMQSAGRAWLDLGFSTVWAIALISCCYLAVPIYGALGVAIGQLVAAAVLVFWQWRLVRKTLIAQGSRAA